MACWRVVSGLALVLVAGCDEVEAPADAAPEVDAFVEIRNGCPVLEAPQAMPGDDIGGDSWETFAQGFFESYCTRCHSTENAGADRQGAPEGLNWDDEASVRASLDRIRFAVGEVNFMPPSEPEPTCEERQRLIRWIDADAP